MTSAAAAMPGAASIREFHYRSSHPALGQVPGHHRSPRGDSGFEFRGHASLLDAPDPRRLDLQASLRDPFGAWTVRVYSQRKAVPVVLLADLSASMGFVGRRRRMDVLADFAESLAWSAWRTGDSFGCVACDDTVRSELGVPQGRARGAGAALARALRALEPQGRSAVALRLAAGLLGRRRSLVFLVSDFHWPPGEITAVLASLAAHELVPVVLSDPAEFGFAAERGLAQVVDPESGRQRLVWWRPSLRRAWAARAQARHAELRGLFRAQRLRPLFIDDGFDADAVTRHFQA